MPLNLQDIDERVEALDLGQGFSLIYDLLLAYGLPKASVSRLLAGAYDRAAGEREVLWKGKVYYQYVASGEADLHSLIDASRSDARVIRDHPRFLVVRDDEQLVAEDRRTGDTLDTSLAELRNHTAFFLPWAGIEKTQVENLNLADIKAADKMARLYDEVIRHNEITRDDVHGLNVFFSRLLFCFFAEDTEVFLPGQFTNAIASLTAESGSDVATFLDQLFDVLNTKPADRKGIPAHLSDFGYVNGKLFSGTSPAPLFSAKARRLVLECGTLDWSQINPDIFGSMIQAVVHPEQREGLGMHYTSVENIMKVIRPLFLDDLEAELESGHDDPARLQRLLDRLSRVRVFDPACGSGNFLVIAYKELRKLEHQALLRLHQIQSGSLLTDAPRQLFPEPRVRLEHFYGIEIDDFAHEIARLSLWLAKHQMNLEYRELFDVLLPLIPLKESGHVVCANAARLDWTQVIQRTSKKEEIFVLGNPPYLGGTRQSEDHKADLEFAFDDPDVNKYLDYVSIWLIKGAAFVESQGADLGFVVTNSVCQGNHVGLLWPRMYTYDVEISFAHSSFLWSNHARRNAGVTCVIVGLAPLGRRRTKRWYGDGRRRDAKSINSYLVPDGPNVIVLQSSTPLNGLPPMVFGSMPRDGGGLALTPAERDELLNTEPRAEPFIRRYTGAEEFLNGTVRYCLWISDSDADRTLQLPAVAARLETVRKFRELSKASSTRKFAAEPHRFVQRAHRETPSIIVPSVSSERRPYIPMGFLDQRTVISNAANAVYGAEPWIFALIQSRMHMTWVRAVAGRLKSDYRYSAVLVYNTFPVPSLPPAARATLTEHVYDVLAARELFPGTTLAELYDPDKMPDGLRRAHEELDTTVDLMYRRRPFSSDEERLELLFAMYAGLVASEGELFSA